ncbi:MAG: pyruvate dehydrogenase (acetyl-transferring) E1 component subunit alpha [Deltaproteobacteria bacterium]|nr:pyruvate dehydrogenase (acetyl-transferring) E1 component subunit alpha [Deltaproteobacteria bacterium]
MPAREIGPFHVQYVQVLDEHGNLDEALEPSLSEEQLVRLYRTMTLAREADQRMLKLQRQGRIGTFGPCTGMEAPSAATALAMTDRDWFVSAFREYAGWLMRGIPPANHYIAHNGWEEGNAVPAALRTLPMNIIVGSQAPHAVGIAYAMKLKGEKDSAVAVFFGDGATSQGELHEAMNFASVWRLPVIFVCQNNQWAISVPLRKQTASRTLAQKAIGYEIPAFQVDGNDALAVYRVAKEALDRAHAGEGPTFIEAVTYRLMMHTTSDDPRRYRTEADEQEWWKKEPLGRLRGYMERKGFWTAERQAAMEADVKREVEEAVKQLEAATGMAPDLPFEHVYGERHESIEEQRAEFLASLRPEAGRG